MADAWMETLTQQECVSLLKAHDVGRVAFQAEKFPVVLPVNYKLIDGFSFPLLAIRTRPGNLIDRAPMQVALEVDEIDRSRRQGWSVLVRGILRHLSGDTQSWGELLDPHPWLTAERDSWLLLDPVALTGRRLHAGGVDWAFHVSAYL